MLLSLFKVSPVYKLSSKLCIHIRYKQEKFINLYFNELKCQYTLILN